MSDNKKITMYIYKTTTQDGDVYIGKRTLRHGTDPASENYYGSGVKMRELLQEHDRCYFSKEILYSINGFYEDIAPGVEAKERASILAAQKKYGEHCLNKYISSAGVKRTQATKDKIRRGHLGLHQSEETRAKMSASHKGKHLSQETKDKISATKRAKSYHKKLLDDIFKMGA